MPLFQSEAECKAIDMKTIFNSHANKTHFHKKDFALGLGLKVRNSEIACVTKEKTAHLIRFENHR